MTPDPKLRAALEPAWSELREQRLLGRIAEGRRQRAGRQRRTLLAVGAAALCGVAAVAVVGLRHRAPVAAGRAAPGAPHLTLADGSEATLASDGNVQVEEQTLTRVKLRQRAGSARYVVKHDPGRDFVVRAEDVTIRVRGTIFSVELRGDTVAVTVERGRVEVSDRLRARELVAGESLSLPAYGPAAPPAPAEEAPPAAAPVPAAAPHGAAHPAGADLLARADAARAAGRPGEAARALEAFVATHPADPRTVAALFTLGRVESARGQWEAAAQAFDRCVSARAQGPLADDALAEGAQAWQAAGVAARARADARAYLAAHPDGLHAAAMRRLANE
ncbi:MAG TPA: FecR domain-containing protein [Polyangia bacterium]|nr:FecR domain-containing protein [Polyangia bacterium]